MEHILFKGRELGKFDTSASTVHTRVGGPSIINGRSNPNKLSSDCDTDNINESERSADDLSSASVTDLASEGINDEDMSGGSVNHHSVQAEPVNHAKRS